MLLSVVLVNVVNSGVLCRQDLITGLYSGEEILDGGEGKMKKKSGKKEERKTLIFSILFRLGWLVFLRGER